MILGQDNQKMSKSRGNVVTPDEIISEYGADSLRLYEMFMGPLEATKPWSMSGVEGVYRFLARVWRLAMEENQEGTWRPSSLLAEIELSRQQRRVVHATIKKVTQDIEALAFNTAISQMMICVNAFTNVERRPLEAIRPLLILLGPFAPHIADEIWYQLSTRFSGFDGIIAQQPWPSWNEEYLIEDEIEVIIQVNGKLRDRMTVTKDLDEAGLEKLARASAKIQETLRGRTVSKVVVVPNKIVNLVTG
jgi:leucyl-tRNA synthetase